MLGILEMASPVKKKPKPTPPPSARPALEEANVHSARIYGTDKVYRVVDTLDAMVKRKQLTQLQFMAADRIRTAHQTLYGTMGNSMDFDRVRSASASPMGPGLAYAMAAEIESDLKKYLYPKHFAIVVRVCIWGLSLSEVAHELHWEYERGADGKPTRAALEIVGKRFKEGLEGLADRWWPDGKVPRDKQGNETRKMRSHVSERPGVTDVEAVPQASSVAHATRDRVYLGGK